MENNDKKRGVPDNGDDDGQCMQVEDSSLNVSDLSTGGSSSTGDTGISGTGGDVSISSGASDVERLYETVSDISKRQRGQFPGMVPHSCVIDPDMVSSFRLGVSESSIVSSLSMSAMIVTTTRLRSIFDNFFRCESAFKSAIACWQRTMSLKQ